MHPAFATLNLALGNNSAAMSAGTFAPSVLPAMRAGVSPLALGAAAANENMAMAKTGKQARATLPAAAAAAQSSAPKVAADIEQLANGAAPSTAEKVASTAEKGFWNLVNLEFFPAMAAMGLGAVIKAGDWVRSKTGWGVSSEVKPGILSKTVGLLKVPQRLMQATPLGDLFSPSTLRETAKHVWSTRDQTTKAFDEWRDAKMAKSAAEVEEALKATTGRGGALRFATTHATNLGNVAQKAADKLHEHTGFFKPWEKLNAFRTNANMGKATIALTELEGVLGKEAQHLHSLPSDQMRGLRSAIRELNPMLNQATSSVAVPNLTQKTEALTEALKKIRGHVDSIPNAPKELSATVQALESHAERTVKMAGKAGTWLQRGAAWKGLGTAIGAIPKAIRGMPLSSGLMAGAFLAMGAGALAKTIHERSVDKAGLRHLENDMQGLPEGPLLNELRETLKAASTHSRQHATMKEGVDVATGALSMKMLSGGGMAAMMPMMVAQMFGGAAVDAVVPRDQFAAVYDGVAEAHKKGEKLTASHYGALLFMALPKHLAHIRSDGPLMREVVEDYAKAQISPKELLQEIASGHFDARAAAIKERTAAAMAKATAKETPATVTNHPSPAPSALNGTPTHNLTAYPVVAAIQTPTPLSTLAAHDPAPSHKVAAMAHDGRLAHAAGIAVA